MKCGPVQLRLGLAMLKVTVKLSSLRVLVPCEQQRSPNSSGHSRGQDSGRSGRHNEPVQPPLQQEHSKSKEKNNGYVVRPPGSEPLEGHRRYTKIREINSGGFRRPPFPGSGAICMRACSRDLHAAARQVRLRHNASH